MSTFSGGMSWNVAFHGSQGSSRAPYRWSWRRSSVTKLRPWRSPQRCSASWSIGSIHIVDAARERLDSERDLIGFHPSFHDIAFYKTLFCSISFEQKRENFLTVVGVWHRQAIPGPSSQVEEHVKPPTSSVAAVMFAMPWYGSTQKVNLPASSRMWCPRSLAA